MSSFIIICRQNNLEPIEIKRTFKGTYSRSLTTQVFDVKRNMWFPPRIVPLSMSLFVVIVDRSFQLTAAL